MAVTEYSRLQASLLLQLQSWAGYDSVKSLQVGVLLSLSQLLLHASISSALTDIQFVDTAMERIIWREGIVGAAWSLFCTRW